MTTLIVPHWLPTDPPRPCPDFMVAEEVAMLLRLEGRDIRQQLQRLRDGGLPCAMMGGRMVYPRDLVIKWMEERAEAR